MGTDLTPLPAQPTMAEASTFLANFTSLRNSSTELADLLKDGLALLIAALPGSACALLYIKQDNQLTLAAHHYSCPEVDAPKPRPDLAAQVVEYIKPITIMVHHPTNGYIPILGLPLVNNDQPLGALIMQADTRIYSDDDTALLHTAAAQLAAVIAEHVFLKRPGGHGPAMQRGAAHAERIVEVLVRARTETVKGDGEIFDA